MSDILKPTGLDKKFSYEIEKDGKIYIAGAENCVFSGTDAIFGDMFLEKKRKLFFNEKKIFIPNQIVAFEAWNNSQNYKDSFEPFSRDLNGQIMKEYNMKMSQEDLSLFFEKLHRHYTNYLK